MRRIYFDRNGRVLKPFFPFWQPWGCLGCLWRVLLFLLGMILIAFLLSLLFRGCDGKLSEDGPVSEEPYEPIKPLPEELSDTTRVKEWNDSIPGVPELPAPKDNLLPPVDSTMVKPDPEDSLVSVIANHIIVLFNSKKLKDDMASFARQFKSVYPDAAYSVVYYNPLAGTMLLKVPEERTYELLDEIPTHIRDIDYKLTTDPLLHVERQPSDPDFKNVDYDKYFRAIQAYEGWDITRGSADIKVAIVDTYFCLDNPELNSRYVDPIHIPSKTRNVLPRALPRPPFRNVNELNAFCAATHGSHVAGIAIGEHDNGYGTGGIAPKCSWIPISVGNAVPLMYIIEGILYAVYHGADVVNVSMGNNYPPNYAMMVPMPEQARRTKVTFKRQEDVWEFVYKTACDHKCVICTSAGNSNIIMGVDAAKRSSQVIKVEATEADGSKRATEFSNFGTVPSLGIDISTVSAPGVGIWSSVAYGKNFIMKGTSQATPFVTGTVALMKSLNKDLTPAQIIDILQRTGKPFSRDNMIGPLIQIRKALEMVKTGVPPAKADTMKYKEVVEDHNKILGKWESTKVLDLTDENDKKVDELFTTIEFTSTERGVIEHRTRKTNLIYRAPLVLKWGKNTLSIVQQGKAVCTNDPSDTIERDDFVCRPGAGGLMEVSVMRAGRLRFKFYMRKIR